MATEQEVGPATIEACPASCEELVLECLPHVMYIARRIHYHLPPQVLLEDLVHAGVLGLMEAIRRFDPRRNVRLKQYAEFRIRGAILDSLRREDWSPRTLRRQARRLERAIWTCETRLGCHPTEPEIAAELQVSLECLQRLLRDLDGLKTQRLQVETNDSAGEKEAPNCGAAAEEADPFCRTLRSEMTGLLARTMDELPCRQREVLILYHFRGLSMKAVGSTLGIGESRVSQIHTDALRRLRVRFGELLNQKMPGAGARSPMFS